MTEMTETKMDCANEYEIPFEFIIIQNYYRIYLFICQSDNRHFAVSPDIFH